MENFAQSPFKMEKLSSPNKVLQALKKVQFVMEFFVLSKYSDNVDVISQFLLAIQAFKFYYKMAHFAHQKNIYMEHHQQKPQIKQSLPVKPLQKMSQLLQKIKTKPYESYNYQPQQFQELACGKKIQLITSVKVPQLLKKSKLSFLALLGQVLSLLRPLISIIGIRLYGLNNYKSYLLSLGIDLLILLIFQRNLKVSKKQQIQQLQGRKKQFITRYLFRRPLFTILKKMLFQPVLKTIIREDRMLYKFIISILEMQSSITLTV